MRFSGSKDSGSTFRQAVRAPEFWMLVVTAVLGVMRTPAWVAVPLAMAYLSISSMPKYVALWPRAREAGSAHEWWRTVGLSVLNTAAAACAAYLLGRVMSWLCL